jgi:hypothetical protein
MSDVIKAISMWQPWGSLWLSPNKAHENPALADQARHRGQDQYRRDGKEAAAPRREGSRAACPHIWKKFQIGSVAFRQALDSLSELPIGGWNARFSASFAMLLASWLACGSADAEKRPAKPAQSASSKQQASKSNLLQSAGVQADSKGTISSVLASLTRKFAISGGRLLPGQLFDAIEDSRDLDSRPFAVRPRVVGMPTSLSRVVI